MRRTIQWLVFGFCLGGAAVSGVVTAQEAQDADPAKLEEEARAGLDGTVWTLQLRSLDGDARTKEDTLTFQGRTVTSKRLVKAGYSGSNYSLRIDNNGVAVWETMQSKEGGDVVFWRGELRGEATMRGVVSEKPAEGETKNFSFAASKTGMPEPVEPPSPVESPQQVEPPPTEAGASEVAPPEASPAQDQSDQVQEAPQAHEPPAPTQVEASAPAPQPEEPEQQEPQETKKKKKRKWF